MPLRQESDLNQGIENELHNSSLNSSKKSQILVVDDTVANLNLASDFLTYAGFEVLSVKSGSQALKILERASPDLILLDILMPEMDGFETCRRLKAWDKTKDIPVIFMTAVADFANPGNKVKGLTLGAVDYISKPIQLEEVLACIKTHLHLHFLTQQLTEQNARLQEEIEERQKAEQALHRNAFRLRHQNKVLTELARNPALHQGDLLTALKAITEATAQDLDVERVSVWLFDETRTKIQCLDLFEKSLNRHSAGVELLAADYPAYFRALTQQQLIVADDAHTTPETQEFSASYLTPLAITSMLDAPIRMEGKTVGVLCSEHTGVTRHWTPEDQNFARSAADLVSLAIEARERKLAQEALSVSEAREREKAQVLELALKELKRTQAQLIQAEKMSSLGRMVAGVAHEINNPTNFIYGNITYAREYFQDLLRLLKLYQQTYPEPTPKIQQLSEEIDLDFRVADWSKLIHSMQVGAERIQQIVLSLKNFSRLDEEQFKLVNIHEGIENTLVILQHRLRAEGHRPYIEVIKDYGQLPKVSCYASQLNQVFMNLLSNAIDALETQPESRIITIRTSLNQKEQGTKNKEMQQFVEIRIADNGSGMSEAVHKQIFDPFFTTKPVGSGTGLGLAISYQIVAEKHQGQISCISALGKGTELIIEIPVNCKCSYQ